VTTLEEYQDVLRSLASYVGNGGYNATEVNPDIFYAKIKDGIDRVTERPDLRSLIEQLRKGRVELQDENDMLRHELREALKGKT